MKIFLFTLLLTNLAFSCGWVNGTTLDGGRIEFSSLTHSNDWIQESLNMTAKEKAFRLEEDFTKEQRKDPVNQAVLNMLRGKTKEAIATFRRREKARRLL